MYFKYLIDCKIIFKINLFYVYELNKEKINTSTDFYASRYPLKKKQENKLNNFLNFRLY